MTTVASLTISPHRWFGKSDMRGFGHHSRVAQMGYSRADYEGKPVIAIINTWSDINQCHAHFRRAERKSSAACSRRWLPARDAGHRTGRGLPKPTTMLYRNLLAMQRNPALYPVDAVLMGEGKTTPALLMGAISDLPASASGSMLRGDWRGQFLLELRCLEVRPSSAGNLTDEQWHAIEDGIARRPAPA
jgi:dihydroxy-acid dehydratase